MTQTKTTKFGVSVNVEEDFKAWIFARVKASINVNVEKSWETSVGEQTSFSVPAHYRYTTQYRVARERVHCKKTHINRQCKSSVVVQGDASAPYEDYWSISSKKL